MQRRLRALERAAGQVQHDLLSRVEMAELDRLPEDQRWQRFGEIIAERLPEDVKAKMQLVYGDYQAE